MKAVLKPVYFPGTFDDAYRQQLGRIEKALENVARIEEPCEVNEPLPEDIDAVLLPVVVGAAYSHAETFRKAGKPVLFLTSEFLTIAMWDWELRSFYKKRGIQVLAPYNSEMTVIYCRTLGLIREMKNAKFLVYQETPGDGMQAEIFKRFYWWEQMCAENMEKVWGIQVMKKSLKELGMRTQEAKDRLEKDEPEIEAFTEEISAEAEKETVKLYHTVLEDVKKTEGVVGVGMNCLNESFYCPTTPCLVWQMLYEKSGILWACEADLMSLLTEYLVHNTIDVPVMMTNIYPFLMGKAAIKHEKIQDFPEMEQPENCLLAVHCGYFGCMPKKFAQTYTVREKVLEIVPRNAIAVDARYPEGPVTILQMDQNLKRMLVLEGNLEKYVGYEGSDCRNGAVIRVKDGYGMMRSLLSHHAIIVPGHIKERLSWSGEVLQMELN